MTTVATASQIVTGGARFETKSLALRILSSSLLGDYLFGSTKMEHKFPQQLTDSGMNIFFYKRVWESGRSG